MQLSKIKNLLPAPEDGLTPAVAVFSPPVLWVETGEDGLSKSEIGTFVNATVMADGRAIAHYTPVIISSPSGADVAYDDSVHAFHVGIEASTPASSFEGEVKVAFTVTDNGKELHTTRSFMIVAKKEGEKGDNPVIYGLITSVSVLSADSKGNVLTEAVTVDAYRIEGMTRTPLPLGNRTLTDGCGHWIQYCRDSGNWTTPSSSAYRDNTLTLSASIVRSTERTLSFRLVRGASVSAAEVVLELPPIPVVKHGAQGETGPWWFPAGKWSVERSYERTERNIPVVEYADIYYYPKDVGVIVAGGQSPDQNSAWIVAYGFEFVFTKVLFATFAKLGPVIVNGDWTISQHGKQAGAWSEDYTRFDTEHPGDSTGMNFLPNLAFDFKTGEAYMQAAHVEGTVKADSLYISSNWDKDCKWVAVMSQEKLREFYAYMAQEGRLIQEESDQNMLDSLTDGTLISLLEETEKLAFLRRITAVPVYEDWETGIVKCTGTAQKIYVFYHQDDSIYLPAPSLYPGKTVEVYNHRGGDTYVSCASTPEEVNVTTTVNEYPERLCFAQAVNADANPDFHGVYAEGDDLIVNVGAHYSHPGFTVSNGRKHAYHSMRLCSSQDILHPENNEYHYFWVCIESTAIF